MSLINSMSINLSEVGISSFHGEHTHVLVEGPDIKVKSDRMSYFRVDLER